MFEITTPGHDAGIASPAYVRSNIRGNNRRIQKLPSSCHNVCNKFFSTVNRGFLHQCLDVSPEEIQKVRSWDPAGQCPGPIPHVPQLVIRYIQVEMHITSAMHHPVETIWKNHRSEYLCAVPTVAVILAIRRSDSLPHWNYPVLFQHYEPGINFQPTHPCMISNRLNVLNLSSKFVTAILK